MTTPAPSGELSAADSGKDVAWIAYLLHAIGYVLFMMWPALVGVIINYVKRGSTRGGFADSHHDWMIRTFWFGLLWYVLSLAVLFSSAWPWLQAVLEQRAVRDAIVIEWPAIFSSLGAAALGGVGLLATWFWLLYRVIRGAVRLSNSQPVP